MNSGYRTIWFGTFLLLFASLAISQEVIVLDDIRSDNKREEVQRYFGYDDLLTNYLTIPYDSVMNTNEKGKFVDIGHYSFLLIPLFMLYVLLRKSEPAFYAAVLLLFFYLSFCFSHSIIFDKQYVEQAVDSGSWDAFYHSPDLSWDQYILSRIYQLSDVVATPINMTLTWIVSIIPKITYALLFVLFVSVLYTFIRTGVKKKIKLVVLILLIYGFFWVLLAGGIIWYGFLLIPLSLMIIGYYFNKAKKDVGIIKKLLVLTTWGVLTISAVLMIVMRISNINVSRQLPEEHIGKAIVESNLFYYSTGLLDAEQTVDNSFRNLSGALKRINSDDHMIYMIGTSFAFDIQNNTRRLFTDNTLSYFLNFRKQYLDKQTLADVLKVSDFKYIVVDLNTNTLDRTPEKSLTQKFKLFLDFLYQNPKLSLIATDRIVEFVDSNGNTQRIGNVFGKIVHRGSYAVYEIL